MSTQPNGSALVLTPDDLANYMGRDVDSSRAALFITLAMNACAAYVSPVPPSAMGVVLKLAAQGYATPLPEKTEHAGPFSVSMPSNALSGVTPSAADQRMLRLLAGRGGAFTIDPTPSTVTTGGMPWDENVEWLDGVPLMDQDDMEG